MKVVITSSTGKETEQLKQQLHSLYNKQNAGLQLSFHISGVGMLNSCFSIAKLIFEQKPDLIIQAGIAGTFNYNIALGNVVSVKDEILADTGVEENGEFRDLFDLNLQQENEFPFVARKLENIFISKVNFLQLEEVTGITVNEITTRRERIEDLKMKYQPAIELMEGASLHYCCLMTSTPFIQIRAISNYIGERDKSKWRFKEAFDNLTNVVINYIKQLDQDGTSKFSGLK